MHYIEIYLIMAVCFLALDAVWLGLIAKNFYKKYIGKLMAKKPNLVAAAVFYALFLFGLLLLVVLPAQREHSLTQLLWTGTLFGLVTYGTYDLTSQALIKDWPLRVTVVDLCWGTLVSTLVALFGYWAAIVLLT